MSFTAEQTALLNKPLAREHVATRKGGGGMLSYIESHHAIREANRLFGFDGWNSETVDLRCVSEQPGSVTYVARVRVTVFAGDRTLIREGVGAGTARGQVGDAHENACKSAESDAQKRALRHFGDQFGLALYDKNQDHVADENMSRREPAIAAQTLALPAPANATPAPPATREPMSTPTARDSDKVKRLILAALPLCATRDEALEFSQANGQKSANWALMLPIDQRIVLKAVKDKFAEINFEEKARAKALEIEAA